MIVYFDKSRFATTKKIDNPLEIWEIPGAYEGALGGARLTGAACSFSLNKMSRERLQNLYGSRRIK